MKRNKKQREKDIMKLHSLVIKKLDETMMSIESGNQWKKVKGDGYQFTLIMSWVIEECLYRWLDVACIHTVKDALNDKLQSITSHKVIQAKADREEATLN